MASMKTVEEWLHELPSPYREKALRHHKFYNKLGKTNCLANALVLAFKWTSTSEGGKYWQEVHKMCMEGRFKDVMPVAKLVVKPKPIETVFVAPKEIIGKPRVVEVIMYRPFEERKKQIDKQTKN